MDTQAMALPSKGPVDKSIKYSPYPVITRTVFTDKERLELKQIIREVINEFI